MTTTTLTPYELAMLFHELATQRCTSFEEDLQRQLDMEAVGAEMDRRDVRLEDWDVCSRQS